MRDLKFRLVLGDKVLPVKLIEFKDGKLLRVAPADRERVEWFYPGHPSFCVEQWTGLLDKNGVAIWEGDILRIDWHDKRYPVHNIGPVEWDKRNACWQLGEGGTAEDDAIHNMEVIGNVHEHSHLLTKEGA